MKHKLHVGVFGQINPKSIHSKQVGSSWVNEEGKDTLPRPNPHDYSGSNKQASHTLC